MKNYMNVIFKKLWIVLLIPFITVAAAAGLTFYLMEPEYEASTTIFINGNNFDSTIPIMYEDILISQMLTKDYKELIKSRSVTKAVLDQLAITGLTPDDLAKKISVELKNETRILEIKLVDTDPRRAQLLADKLSNVFIEKIKDLMKVENIEVVDSAEIPESPISPNPYLNIAIALVTGIFLALCIILIMDYVDDTVKTAEDIVKQLGLTVLGTIPLSDIG